MRFAYADPPYLNCCKLYGHYHPDGKCWDDIQTHADLIASLEQYDGWVLSLSSPSLRYLLPLTPEDTRVGSWVKPFCSFKPNVNPAYAWEPYFFRGGRKFERYDATVRDYVSANITLKKGLTGAKPEDFSMQIFRMLNARSDDEFVDLFPGTGLVTEAWRKYCGQFERALAA